MTSTTRLNRAALISLVSSGGSISDHHLPLEDYGLCGLKTNYNRGSAMK